MGVGGGWGGVGGGGGREEGGGRGRGGGGGGGRGEELFDVGGLRLVQVAGAAVGVVFGHVPGGALDLEVPATRASGGEADGAATPEKGHTHTQELQPVHCNLACYLRHDTSQNAWRHGRL